MVDFNKVRLSLRPSHAHIWMECTASPAFIRDNAARLPSGDDKFNQEGKLAHLVAASELLGKPVQLDEGFTVDGITSEMRWHAWNYAEYVWTLKEKSVFILPKIAVEEKVALFYGAGHGTVDCCISNHNSLHIVDYKYGVGVTVEAEENLQLIIYAISIIRNRGLVREADFPISIHIYQPRGQNAEVPFKVWETNWGHLEKRAEEISQTADQIRKGTGIKFSPSKETCGFCPANGICPARKQAFEEIEALAVVPDSPKEFPPVKAVSLTQLAAIVRHGETIIRWVRDAQAYALDYMLSGNPLPGHKLVMSREGNRKWSNPKEAGTILQQETMLKEEEIFEVSVISPAEAEKLLGKGKLPAKAANLISRSPAKPKIVLESAKGELWNVTAENEFEKLE